MKENPYQPPEIESDAPEHPPSIIVGGLPGLRERYRIEWRFIAIFVLVVIASLGVQIPAEFVLEMQR